PAFESAVGGNASTSKQACEAVRLEADWRSHLIRNLLIAAFALGAPLTASAEVLFRADYETGDITQWERKQVVSDDRVQIVDAPVAEGGKALKVTVLEGDDPIDASGNRNEL